MSLLSSQNTLSHSHSPQDISRRLAQQSGYNYLGDFVLGAIDGCVTTFAVVSGAAGAGLPGRVAVIMGIANLIADGFSMAAGNYQKARSDRLLLEKARRMEQLHIESIPEGEVEEVRQIFANKGFEGAILDEIVQVITSDQKRWIDTMLTEELGLTLETPAPIKPALATYVAFILVGLIPLLPFLFFPLAPQSGLFGASTLAALAAFALIGIVKGKVTRRSLSLAAIETVLVGGAATLLSYVVGLLLRRFV